MDLRSKVDSKVHGPQSWHTTENPVLPGTEQNRETVVAVGREKKNKNKCAWFPQEMRGRE